MNRRDFGWVMTSGVVGAALGSSPGLAAAPPGLEGRGPRGPQAPRPTFPMSYGPAPRPPLPTARKKPPMFASGNGRITREGLEFLARHGIFYCDAGTPQANAAGLWDYDELMRQRELAEKYNVKIESYHIDVDDSIMLGRPERDQHIERMKQKIEVAGRAGVRALLYNMVLEGNLRTGRTGPDTKRGNLYYNSWYYDESIKTNAGVVPEGGPITADMTFDRIKYMLDRLLPVAEKAKVQLGCHPPDPPTNIGYRGITRWNAPDIFAGFRRFCEMYNSPYHGLNLCVGVTAEGVNDPRTDVVPIVKWLAERNKIFNVHMRNIRGGFNRFMEVSIDDGDTDLAAVMRALRDAGYKYGIQPDHTIQQPEGGDPNAGEQYTAFCFGYIKALIQAVGSEPV